MAKVKKKHEEGHDVLFLSEKMMSLMKINRKDYVFVRHASLTCDCVHVLLHRSGGSEKARGLQEKQN